MEDTNAALLFDTRAVVGESLIWDDRRDRLVWIDIIGRSIHRLEPLTLAHEWWRTPDLVTSIGLRADGGAIVGLRNEIALWDFGGPFRTIAAIEPDRPDIRLNEGVVAPDGSFWVGTMANNIGADDEPVPVTQEAGQLFRIAPDGGVARLSDDRFGITNTMVWKQDGRFVTADTMKNAIYDYAWDGGSLRLTNRRLLFGDFQRGLPDGSCMDAEGHIWNCRVAGGSCLARIAPDGRLDRIVELPCSWPTSCAFGGPDLDTLFVTSARFTMTAEHLETHPHEGGLFALRPGERGAWSNRFG